MKSDFFKAFCMLALFLGLLAFNEWVGFAPQLGTMYVIAVTALASIIIELYGRYKTVKNKPVIIADEFLIHENNILRKKLENLKLENDLLTSKLLVAEAKKQLLTTKA